MNPNTMTLEECIGWLHDEATSKMHGGLPLDEIEEKYCAIAARRMAEEANHLFAGSM